MTIRPGSGPLPRSSRHGMWVVGLAATLLLAACAGAGSTASASAPASPPEASSGSAAPVSPVEGIVLTIDSQGLTQVHGFTLRTKAGDVMTFSIGQLDDPTQFPPGHLAEHQASALPVRVYFRDVGGTLVVYRLEDASG